MKEAIQNYYLRILQVFDSLNQSYERRFPLTIADI